MTKLKRDAKIVEFTNIFYNIIPHDFGNAKPPLINTDDLLKEKIKLLDTLMDLANTATLLNSTKTNNSLSLIDQHYEYKLFLL